MRISPILVLLAAAAMPATAATPAAPEPAFDACTVFTQQDAARAMGTAAAPEPVNPKAKRPKVVTGCNYTGVKDGKAVLASAQFRTAKSDAEAQRAFEEARLKFQTKPLLLPGAEAFWSGKTGQMHVRKGRTWITVAVGPEKLSERDVDEARKLAEILIKRL